MKILRGDSGWIKGVINGYSAIKTVQESSAGLTSWEILSLSGFGLLGFPPVWGRQVRQVLSALAAVAVLTNGAKGPPKDSLLNSALSRNPVVSWRPGWMLDEQVCFNGSESHSLPIINRLIFFPCSCLLNHLTTMQWPCCCSAAPFVCYCSCLLLVFGGDLSVTHYLLLINLFLFHMQCLNTMPSRKRLLSLWHLFLVTKWAPLLISHTFPSSSSVFFLLAIHAAISRRLMGVENVSKHKLGQVPICNHWSTLSQHIHKHRRSTPGLKLSCHTPDLLEKLWYEKFFAKSPKNVVFHMSL